MKKSTHFLLLSVIMLLAHNVHAITYDTLCQFGATWKYLDDGTSQDATNWKLGTYSDASWASGPSPLGYGDPWIVTCIHSGCGSTIDCNPTCTTKTITDYFRKSITVPSVAAYDSVSFDVQIDDGLALYVNGTKVWTYNMASTWTYTTVAPATIDGTLETDLQHVTIPMTAWTNGANTVAIETHQRGAVSSDVTLDVRMRFKRHVSASTGINNLGAGNQFSIYPNPSNGAFTIESAAPLASADYNMSICDVTGRVIAKKSITFNGTISTQNLDLASGMYFVHLSSGETNATFRISISK